MDGGVGDGMRGRMVDSEDGVLTFVDVSRVDESGVAGWRIVEIGRSNSLGHGPRNRDERRGEGAEDVVQVDAG